LEIAPEGKCVKNGSLPMIFKRSSIEQTAGSTQSRRTGDFGRAIVSLCPKNETAWYIFIVPHVSLQRVSMSQMWAGDAID
jgi:hypothetical protein